MEDINLGPLVSVIVPVYNVEKYLEQCVYSVINQTYKNLEIILVNDGSTDSSGSICDKLAELDKRIKVVHKENGGLSDARNVGIDVSSGDYIAFLDSDDWIDIECYEKLYKLIKKYDADIACCNFKRVYKETEELRHSSEEQIYSNIDALKEIYLNRGLQMIVAWNKLQKKELFIDKRYPKGKIHEDEFLTPRILYDAKKIVYTDDELIYYRYVENSITNSKFSYKNLVYLQALEDRMNLFKKINNSNLLHTAKKRYVDSLIEYFFKVDELSDKSKIDILKNLKHILSQLDLEGLSKKTKIKVQLFLKFSHVFKLYRFLKIRMIKI